MLIRGRFYVMLFWIAICQIIVYLSHLFIQRNIAAVNPAPSGNENTYNYEDLFHYVLRKRNTYIHIPKEWDSIKAKQSNDSCMEIPDLYNLRYNNDYRQKMDNGNGTVFYVHGAYFDKRPSLPGKGTIRILTMIDGYRPGLKLFCYVWLKDVTDGILIPVLEYINLYPWNETGFNSYLISGNFSSEYDTDPVMVSLVEKPCARLQVGLSAHYQMQPLKSQQDFAVCVKGLAYNMDYSLRLIEWLEILFEMGISKVFFHKFEVHPNVEKVFFHYEKRNKIEVLPLSHPADFANIPEVRKKLHFYDQERQVINELIPYNDCFYRNMYKYKYISLLDIDELIVPTKFHSWKAMLTDLLIKGNGTKYPSYCFTNYYYFDNDQSLNISVNSTSSLYILGNIEKYSVPSPLGDYVKCIHDTTQVVTLHNHYSLNCVMGECDYYDVPTDVGTLHHHKQCRDDDECEQSQLKRVTEKSILRYKSKVSPKILRVATILNII